MATPPTDGNFSETIETAAVEPAEAMADGVQVKSRSISELIEADRYLAAKRAAAKGQGGLRFSKIVAPSSVSSKGAS